jgi:hypothetical protein
VKIRGKWAIFTVSLAERERRSSSLQREARHGGEEGVFREGHQNSGHAAETIKLQGYAASHRAVHASNRG